MRAVLWMGSVVVAVAAIIGASRLWAESKEKKPALRTRIGIFNLKYVIKNYDKYKQFQEEIKEFVEPYQKRDAELRGQLEKLRKQAAHPSLVPTKGEDGDEKSKKEGLEEKVKQIQRKLDENTAKQIQRKLDENTAKIKKELGKRSDDMMKNIYLCVTEAAQKYAKAHDLDLVLHYNDAITEQDYLSAQNIARKMNTAALMPLYFPQNMDISRDLVAILNKNLRKE